MAEKGPWRKKISKPYKIDKKWAPEVMEFLQEVSRPVTHREVYEHLQKLKGYRGNDPKHLHTPADHILGWLMELGAVIRDESQRPYTYNWVSTATGKKTSATVITVTVQVVVRESA